MFISPVNMFNTKNSVEGCSFGGHHRPIKRFASHRQQALVAKLLQQVEENTGIEKKAAVVAVPAVAASVISKIKSNNDNVDYGEEIKQYGITYCSVENKNFSIATRNNGAYYKVKLDFDLPKEFTKNFLWAELVSNEPITKTGLKHYINCVNTLGRQDIIQKGLGIYEYELDAKISFQDKIAAARAISKTSDKDINIDDLFFIGGEAHYFSPNERAIYSVNVSDPRLKQVVYKCNFINDEKGNTIGYEKKSWSVYTRQFLNKIYTEQQKPSEKLPEYADEKRIKEFAEVLRFGNYNISHKNRDGVPKVLEHLHRFGFNNVTEKDLQFVRAVKSDLREDNDYYLINYYNPLSGKTLTYDRNGRYLYQTDYIKDEEGQIISCNHE